MNIIIIQEAGRHEQNKNYRESLNLKRAINKIENVNAEVWGLGYSNFSTKFSEIENWADVIFIIENYTSSWLPVNEIHQSKKLKIFWSIDSHCVLDQHQHLTKILGINILLNSTERYLEFFKNVEQLFWFPNCYPSDLIYPMNIEKNIDVGFCGNIINRGNLINYLEKFNIKKDIFVIGDEMVKSINSYKIHFNCNISDDINYRTFETTGCRTLLVTNYTTGLEKLFRIDEEILVYKTIEELDEKIKFALNNDDFRKKISQAGYDRSYKEHTYDERSKLLIEIIKKYI